MTSTEYCIPTKSYLAVNAAEDLIQVVLGREQEILYSQQIRAPAQAMKLLPQSVSECLKVRGLALKDLDGIACVRGPGAFTGLRVASAFVLGLAKGSGLPMAGLDYLPLIASIPCLFSEDEVWVCTYARRNLVYVQGFVCPQAEAIDSAAVVSLQEAWQKISQRSGNIALVGTGIRKNMQFWSSQSPNLNILDRIWDNPPISVLLAKACGACYDHSPVSPLYLRVSDAEANLPQIAKDRGLDLENAYKIINQGSKQDLE